MYHGKYIIPEHPHHWHKAKPHHQLSSSRSGSTAVAFGTETDASGARKNEERGKWALRFRASETVLASDGSGTQRASSVTWHPTEGQAEGAGATEQGSAGVILRRWDVVKIQHKEQRDPGVLVRRRSGGIPSEKDSWEGMRAPSNVAVQLEVSSKAAIRMGDLREGAVVCEEGQGGGGVRLFEDPPDPATTSFFSEITSSISDAQFSPDGMQILARDYLTLKLWDVRSEARPPACHPRTRPPHGQAGATFMGTTVFLTSGSVSGGGGAVPFSITRYTFAQFAGRRSEAAVALLCFARFWAGGVFAPFFVVQFLTGSYHNYFRVYDAEGENNVVLQADKAVLRTKKRGVRGRDRGTSLPSAVAGARAKSPPRSLLEAMQTEPQDFNKKIAHASWHPREATVAIAATNSLFVYSAAPLIARFLPLPSTQPGLSDPALLNRLLPCYTTKAPPTLGAAGTVTAQTHAEKHVHSW
ncbi:hypothetical protein B0H14DRAFT_3170899 [Mycena olivaceomarginata]|nr:hypothetical protein B0H14DRAFT_3170899 [Mycena olivaceomarginata]